VLPIGALLALACGTPLIALAASVDTTVPFSLVQRFVVVQMSLFAGVYFSVSALSPPVRWLAYVSPLWHGVELCRAATTTNHGTLLAAVGHIAYLAVWALAGCWLAQRAFTRQLSD
jgi:lipooligosaccharide transport system permease protein